MSPLRQAVGEANEVLRVAQHAEPDPWQVLELWFIVGAGRQGRERGEGRALAL